MRCSLLLIERVDILYCAILYYTIRYAYSDEVLDILRAAEGNNDPLSDCVVSDGWVELVISRALEDNCTYTHTYTHTYICCTYPTKAFVSL